MKLTPASPKASRPIDHPRVLSLTEQRAPNSKIMVIPEYEALEDGVDSFWAIVQVFVHGRRINTTPREPDVPCERTMGNNHEPSATVCNVTLNDVSIEILPTTRSTIVEVLDPRTCKTRAVGSDSQYLVVAHIRLLPAVPQRPRTHLRQSSDELIEDLERQLGGISNEYIQVRVTYRHPAFLDGPTQAVETEWIDDADNVVRVQTAVQTTAVAAIKRHNSTSPWSSHASTLRRNPLFADMIAAHWGSEMACVVAQHIVQTRSLPPEAGRESPRASDSGTSPNAEGRQTEDGIKREEPGHTWNEDTVRPDSALSTSTAPPIPKRRSSLRKLIASPIGSHEHLAEGSQGRGSSFGADTRDWDVTRQNSSRGPAEATGATENTGCRSGRHLGRIRRVSSSLRRYSSQKGAVSPPPTTPSRNGGNTRCTGSPRPRPWAARCQSERHRTPRSWGWRGADEALVALTPVVADARNGSSGRDKRAGLMASPVGVAGRSSSVKTRRPKGKDKGWSWSSWW
ncbi:hypothetical protein VTK26DRAFT_4077 [Humicola hyalothermophila]